MKYQIYIRIELDEVYEADTREEAIDKAIERTKEYGDIVIDDIEYLAEEEE